MENTTTDTSNVKWVRTDGTEDVGLTFINPSKLAKDGVTGVILEGEYLGAAMGRFGKNDFKFKDLSGKTVVINGAGNLEYNLKNVEPGTLVQISYLGKRPMKNNPGKDSHGFKVLKAQDAE